MISVQLNGEWRELDARGVAVAVEREVVRRGAWTETALTAGARVEILTAIQGG